MKNGKGVKWMIRNKKEAKSMMYRKQEGCGKYENMI